MAQYFPLAFHPLSLVLREWRVLHAGPRRNFGTVFGTALLVETSSEQCTWLDRGYPGSGSFFLSPISYWLFLRLARSNTGSDTCVQYALPDQGPERAGSWSRMTDHLGRVMLTAASPPRGPGKTPLGDEALPVGCHTETIVWTVLGHRLWRLCSFPQEIPYSSSFWASFKKEPVYRFFSHIRRTRIAVMRRWHSFNSLIPHRHSQTHSLRCCLGHTSFSMHGDRRVYSVPRFQPGIDPFIGHPSRNGKMPVYRAPCIRSPIHQGTTTSMTKGSSAKPPHPSFFGKAKRRTSSRCQSKGRSYFILTSHIQLY